MSSISCFWRPSSSSIALATSGSTSASGAVKKEFWRFGLAAVWLMLLDPALEAGGTAAALPAILPGEVIWAFVSMSFWAREGGGRGLLGQFRPAALFRVPAKLRVKLLCPKRSQILVSQISAAALLRAISRGIYKNLLIVGAVHQEPEKRALPNRRVLTSPPFSLSTVILGIISSKKSLLFILKQCALPL